jgi:hypothetical protein
VTEPFFFQEQIVTSTSYLDMLQLFAVAQMVHLLLNIFFKQYGENMLLAAAQW